VRKVPGGKFTIHAIEATLNDSALIFAFLRNVRGSLGLVVYETSLEDEMTASMLMDKVRLDFDDALMRPMKTRYDDEHDILYIDIAEDRKAHDTQQIDDDDIFVDFDD
jgi:hypothetical protein